METDWRTALAHYDSLCQDVQLEQEMTTLDDATVAQMSADEFYTFLHDRYFVWKYTAKNRLASTRKYLQTYREQNDLSTLGKIKDALFSCDRGDARAMLHVACSIRGLGTAGASGLLAVLFPEEYGTADQFLVLSLCKINRLPELDAVSKMKPAKLSLQDGVILEGILRRKADHLNHLFQTDFWTPRKIDMILWSFGRKRDMRFSIDSINRTD